MIAAVPNLWCYYWWCYRFCDVWCFSAVCSVDSAWLIPIPSVAFLHCLPPILPASSSTNEECPARHSPLVSSNEFTPRGDKALVWISQGEDEGVAVILSEQSASVLCDCTSFLTVPLLWTLIAWLCLIFCLSRGIWLTQETASFRAWMDSFLQTFIFYIELQ